MGFGRYIARQWDLGDSVGTSTLQNPTYVLSAPDTFTVTITVTSDSGCTSLTTSEVVVFPLPVADFTAVNVCLYDDAVFNDASTISSGSVTSWQWDFGDLTPGETSQNTTPLYRTNSSYNVTLIVVSNKQLNLKNHQGLKDIAPTVLKHLNIKKPKEMTGKSIII